MPDAIPDLWPDDIAVSEVLTPLAIMRYQAGQLRQKTRNILEAEVSSEDDGEGGIQHTFRIIAPALDRYAVPVFYAAHDQNRPYPVEVGQFWEHEGQFESGDPDADASSPNEFIKEVAEILQSSETKSIIFSLIARSNEATQDPTAT